MIEYTLPIHPKHNKDLVDKNQDSFIKRKRAYLGGKPTKRYLIQMSSLKYHWRSSVPHKWTQILGEDKLVPVKERPRERRNSLSFLSETQRFIRTNYDHRSKLSKLVPSSFDGPVAFPLQSVSIYMRRNSQILSK